MPDQKPRPPLLGPKRASRLSGASSRSPNFGIATASPNKRERDDRQVAQQRVAEPDTVDDGRQADDRDRERRREPEHDAERTAPPAGRARAQQRGQHRQHAGAQRGAGAGDEGEEDENDDASCLEHRRKSCHERVLNLG